MCPSHLPSTEENNFIQNEKGGKGEAGDRERVKWSHKSKRTLREKEGQRGADLLVTNRQINKIIRRPICIQKKKVLHQWKQINAELTIRPT